MDSFLLDNPVPHTTYNHWQADMEWQRLTRYIRALRTMADKKGIKDPDRYSRCASGEGLRLQFIQDDNQR